VLKANQELESTGLHQTNCPKLFSCGCYIQAVAPKESKHILNLEVESGTITAGASQSSGKGGTTLERARRREQKHLHRCFGNPAETLLPVLEPPGRMSSTARTAKKPICMGFSGD
jgi:hypothetical protein